MRRNLSDKEKELILATQELCFLKEDIKGLESQLQQLAQGSSDNLGLPLPAAVQAPAGDKEVEGGGADPGPVSETAISNLGPKVGKTAGLGFTFKRDSRSGNWLVSFPSFLPFLPPTTP